MKLRSWSDKPFLVISQSPHGAYQSGKAIDFAHLSGNAPARGKITYFKPQPNPKQNYFGFGADNWQIQFVHSNPQQKVGSVVDAGKPLWRSSWHHSHDTIEVDGIWEYVLSCLDWDVVPVYWLREGQKHPVWTNKSTYRSIELPPYPVTIIEMVNLQQPIECVSTNTVPMNVRKEPTTKSESIAKMPPQTAFKTTKVARGEMVEGVDTWYGYTQGWVSGKYIKELSSPSNAELEKKVVELTAKNELLTKANQGLVETNEELKYLNDKYKPGYDAAVLINSTK